MIFDGRRDLSTGAFPFMVRRWQQKIALTMYNYRRSLSEFPMLVTAGRLLGDGWITFAKGKKQQIDGDQL